MKNANPCWQIPVLCLALMACTGQMANGHGEDMPPDAEEPEPKEVKRPDGSTCKPLLAGGVEDPVPRLSATQYLNAIEAVLRGAGVHDLAPPSTPFPEDTLTHRFDTNAEGQGITDTLLEAHGRYLDELRSRLVEAEATLAPCEADEQPSACGRRFVTSFGARAFRRPLAPEEIDRYSGFLDALAGDSSFAEAVASVTQAFLQSPQFLYLLEDGEAVEARPGVRKLTAHEIASRLSFLLTGTVPDDELMRAAAEDELGTREQIALQAERLLASGEAQAVAVRTLGQWLDLHATDALGAGAKKPEKFPEFSDDTGPALARSARLFLAHVWDNGGTLRDLFTDPTVFVNDEIAWIYDSEAPSGDQFAAVTIDPDVRFGYFTQAGWLASKAGESLDSPVYRGLFFREDLLCSETPPPPPDVDTTLNDEAPDSDRPLTVRETFAITHDKTGCKECHALFDPMGFAFTQYDAVGRYREKEYGVTLDTSGEFQAIEGLEGGFAGAREMLETVLTSRPFAACTTRAFSEFVFRRTLREQDDCAVADFTAALEASDGDLRSLLVAIATSDTFRHRAVGEAP